MGARRWVYPPPMTPEPQAPPPPRGSRPDPGEPADAGNPEEGPQPGEPMSAERYGPVAIARHAKDDGRALLLYSRIPEDSG